MKSVFFASVVMVWLLSGFHAEGQIQYQTSFDHSGSLVKLEDEGYKFYLMDVPGQQCRVYNLDFSLWQTFNLSVPANRYLTDIAYLSQYLFDADAGIELLYVYYQYVETATSYYYMYTTCVRDDNGTLLLEVPGASWNEIVNVENNGSLLLSYVYDYSLYPYQVKTRIYKLSGQFTGILAEAGSEPDYFEPLYPNPATTIVKVPVPPVIRNDQAFLVITDMMGNLILRKPVMTIPEQIDTKSLGLSAGTYLIRFESSKLQTKSQSLVVTH